MKVWNMYIHTYLGKARTGFDEKMFGPVAVIKMVGLYKFQNSGGGLKFSTWVANGL